MNRIILAIVLAVALAGCSHTGAFKPGQINVANVDANGKLYFTQIAVTGTPRAPDGMQSLSTFNPFAR